MSIEVCGLCGNKGELETLRLRDNAEVFEEDDHEYTVSITWSNTGGVAVGDDDDEVMLSTGRTVEVTAEMRLCSACRTSKRWSLNVDFESY